MMLLRITAIADRGNHEKERIVMRAALDGDVGKYALFRSLINANSEPTTEVTDLFWFPDKAIKANDLVVLYTKPGTTSERLPTSGKTAHFYYWGKPRALWSLGSGYAPVLVQTPEWQWFNEQA
jgi:hypothetical protein